MLSPVTEMGVWVCSWHRGMVPWLAITDHQGWHIHGAMVCAACLSGWAKFLTGRANQRSRSRSPRSLVPSSHFRRCIYNRAPRYDMCQHYDTDYGDTRPHPPYSDDLNTGSNSQGHQSSFVRKVLITVFKLGIGHNDMAAVHKKRA